LKSRLQVFFLLLGLGLGCREVSLVRAAENDLLPLGRQVYEAHCAVCHGQDGKGNGSAASRFKTRPRDFTKGEYKFRSTETGQLPTDSDLVRAIVRGFPGSGMVPQNHLSDAEVRAVIAYIKKFSPNFADRPPPKPLDVPPPPQDPKAAVTRGRKVYEKGQCAVCHGVNGKGDGIAAKDLSVPPADLTRRRLRSGPSPRDIFRTLLTGLAGTPMPSYFLTLDEAEIWDLAYYVDSLGTPPVLTEDERLGWETEGRKPPRR
jgi:cytochrome c oxidase cbb3-type subunit 2